MISARAILFWVASFSPLCSDFFTLHFSHFRVTEWCVCWQADFKMLIQKNDIIFWTDCHWTRQIATNTHFCAASFDLGYGIDGGRIFFRSSGRVRDFPLLRRIQAGCRSNQIGIGISIREDDSESSCQRSNIWIPSYTFITWCLFKNKLPKALVFSCSSNTVQ